MERIRLTQKKVNSFYIEYEVSPYGSTIYLVPDWYPRALWDSRCKKVLDVIEISDGEFEMDFEAYSFLFQFYRVK